MILLTTGFISVFLSYFVYRSYRNTHDVVVNKIDLRKNHSTQNYPTLNILQISDMHLENISISPDDLYHQVQHENIDLIALTGDFLDRKRSIPKLIPYLKVLNKINPKYGIYAVFGNHDYVLRKKNFNKLEETLQKYGCKTLRNKTENIMIDGKTLNIIGIDDFSTNRSDLKKAYQNMKDGYKLVLTHDPNIVLKMKQFDFDYLLSGHFHGGQILYPKPFHLVKMGKLPRMNMVKGLHHYHNKPFYISEGLGQTGVNIRVGSRPEITIHQLTLDYKEEALPAI